MRKVSVGLFLVLALVSFPAMAALSLSVTNAAALQGAFGLRVSFDGTNTQAYVLDNSPNNEPEYHASFRIRADGMIMATDALIQIFRANEETSGSTVFRTVLHKRPSGAATPWAIQVLVARSAGAGGGFYPRIAEGLRPGGDQFTIEWHKGTNATIRLYRNGQFRKKLENANTNDFDVDVVRLGAGMGSTGASGQAGSFLDLDDFISTRTCQFPNCNF